MARPFMEDGAPTRSHAIPDFSPPPPDSTPWWAVPDRSPGFDVEIADEFFVDLENLESDRDSVDQRESDPGEHGTEQEVPRGPRTSTLAPVAMPPAQSPHDDWEPVTPARRPGWHVVAYGAALVVAAGLGAATLSAGTNLTAPSAAGSGLVTSHPARTVHEHLVSVGWRLPWGPGLTPAVSSTSVGDDAAAEHAPRIVIVPNVTVTAPSPPSTGDDQPDEPEEDSKSVSAVTDQEGLQWLRDAMKVPRRSSQRAAEPWHTDDEPDSLDARWHESAAARRHPPRTDAPPDSLRPNRWSDRDHRSEGLRPR